MPNYILKSPVPSQTDQNYVLEGVSTLSRSVMWKDASNVVHFLTTFGESPFYINYVNLGTGANGLITMTGTSSASPHWANHKTSGKIYTGGGSTFSEINPATVTGTTLVTGLSPCLNILIGNDDKVYMATQYNRLYSYDPSAGYPAGWKAYGIVDAGADTGSNYFALGVDAGYVYCGVMYSNGTWKLWISPTSGDVSWTGWEFNGDGDTGLSIKRPYGSTTGWVVERTLADTSVISYTLSGGTWTFLQNGGVQGEYRYDLTPEHCVEADNEDSYNSFYQYGYEVDLADQNPFPDVHEFSEIRYRAYPGGGAWSSVSSAFTGPWVPWSVQCVMPLTGNNVFSMGGGYSAGVNLDYTVPSVTYLGANCQSPYTIMRHSSGEIYAGGYSNRVWRYDPAQPWTLTSATTSAYLPTDEGKPNPYVINMTPTLLHYRHGLEYDANGFVWIGGNTTRQSPNYGNVMWYDPTTGDHDYLFDSWAAAGTYFSHICVAVSRSLICVSDNKDNIFIIDADTKAVVGDPINPMGTGTSKTYMVEVANDDVMGIIIDAGSTYRIFRFKPSDKSILLSPQALGVTGLPFGFGDGQYTRMSFRMVKGPDGYVWVMWGTTLYRIHPSTCVFNSVATSVTAAKISFAANNTDLLVYAIDGSTDFRYYAGILEAIEDYTRGNYASLPTDDADLETAYTQDDIDDVATDNGITVSQSAIDQYAIHEFKNDATGKDYVDIFWDGQTNIPCLTSTVYLQIYNHNTDLWETIKSDNTTGANVDFGLSATVTPLNNYKDGNGIITCRVYQLAQ